MLHVIGITRLALVNREQIEQFPLTRKRDREEVRGIVFNSARMRARLRLFEALALPSVMGLRRPPGVQLSYVVATSADLPADWKAALRGLMSGDGCHCLEIDYDRSFRASLREYVGLVAAGVRVFTFRLDDDDALAVDYLERVAKWAEAGSSGALSFDRGLYIRKTGSDFLIERRSVPNIAIGLGLLSDPDRSETIHDLGNHMQIDKRIGVSNVTDCVGWLRTMHRYNSSGVRRHAGQSMSAEAAAELVAERFPSIDIARVHTAL